MRFFYISVEFRLQLTSLYQRLDQNLSYLYTYILNFTFASRSIMLNVTFSLCSDLILSDFHFSNHSPLLHTSPIFLRSAFALFSLCLLPSFYSKNTRSLTKSEVGLRNDESHLTYLSQRLSVFTGSGRNTDFLISGTVLIF